MPCNLGTSLYIITVRQVIARFTMSAKNIFSFVFDGFNLLLRFFMGGITLAVNCAGIATAGRTLGREGPWPAENFNRVIQVNLVGDGVPERVLYNLAIDLRDDIEVRELDTNVNDPTFSQCAAETLIQLLRAPTTSH